jgi:hypothetical protein
MNPNPDPQRLTDDLSEEARRFDLLEQPEAWPDDPAAQAELADLLELHLLLGGHAADLEAALLAQAAEPTPLRTRRWSNSWALAAAAVLLVALIPASYTVKRIQTLKAQAQDTARIEALAQKRTQDRAWIAFFRQSTTLLRDFEQNPAFCSKDEEDRRQEREMAMTLLETSHQLVGQGAPTQEAEAIRANLHAWLMELAAEDSCLNVRRAEELRQWASTHNLESQAGRMEQRLRGDGA